MNIQLKSWVVIILTLVLGFSLGLLTQRSVSRHGALAESCDRHPPLAMGPGKGMAGPPPMMFNQPGIFFMRRIEHWVEPTSEQREKLKPLAESYSKQFQQRMEAHRREFMSLVKAMETEFQPILTPQQQERLRVRMQRHEQMESRMGPGFGKSMHQGGPECERSGWGPPEGRGRFRHPDPEMPSDSAE